MKHHLKHMAIAGGAILVVLLLLRVDLRTAVQYAILLACPLGMVGMMFMMNKNGGHNHGQGADDGEQAHGAGAHDHCGAGHGAAPGHDHEHADTPPPQLTRDNHERLP
jgi:MFS superfamily sulfate permease-like transporter